MTGIAVFVSPAEETAAKVPPRFSTEADQLLIIKWQLRGSFFVKPLTTWPRNI